MRLSSLVRRGGVCRVCVEVMGCVRVCEGVLGCVRGGVKGKIGTRYIQITLPNVKTC